MDGGATKEYHDLDIEPDEEEAMTRFGQFFTNCYNFQDKYQGKTIGVQLMNESDIVFRTPDGLIYMAAKLIYPFLKDWSIVVNKLKRMKNDGDECHLLLEDENQESDDSSDTSSSDNDDKVKPKITEALVHNEQESPAAIEIKSNNDLGVSKQKYDDDKEVDEDVIQIKIDEDIEESEQELTELEQRNNYESNDVNDVQHNSSPKQPPQAGEQEHKMEYEKKTQQLNKLINDVEGLLGQFKERIEKQKENAQTDQRCDDLRCEDSQQRNSTMRVNNMAEANRNQGPPVEQPRAAMQITRRDPKDRCYECHDYGHQSYDCPYKGKGVKKCYECNQFGTHIGRDCPQRIARQQEGSNFNNNNNNYNNNYRSKTYINKQRY